VHCQWRYRIKIYFYRFVTTQQEELDHLTEQLEHQIRDEAGLETEREALVSELEKQVRRGLVCFGFVFRD
jgi:hypothetical protein